MKLRPFLIPVILVAGIVLMVGSCSKSGNSKPKISLKSTTPTFVDNGQDVHFIFEFSNSNAVARGKFISLRTRLNQHPIPSTEGSTTDTIPSNVPDFPDQNKGEFDYAIPYFNLNEGSETDTFRFRFALTDRNGVTSDTISSPIVIVLTH